MRTAEPAWRVAIVDSGFTPRAGLTVTASARWHDAAGRIREGPVIADPTGHGSAVTEIIAGGPVIPQLLVAQVFSGRGLTSAAVVAAAIDWASRHGAQLLHLSLGLPENRRVLSDATAAAIGRDIVMVAASPARGAACFPAAYPGVIRATGDARCGPGDLSVLDSAQADFGGCPRSERPGARQLAGASIGAAYLTQLIVAHCSAGATAAAVAADLRRIAKFHGCERRQG